MDEPLEGDIGPSAEAGPAEVPRAAAARTAELRRFEAEREERRRRANARAGAVAKWLAALLLAFLAQDSIRTAVEARSKGDPWLYPPAVLAAVFVAGLVLLAVLALRSLRRRRGH